MDFELFKSGAKSSHPNQRTKLKNANEKKKTFKQKKKKKTTLKLCAFY